MSKRAGSEVVDELPAKQSKTPMVIRAPTPEQSEEDMPQSSGPTPISTAEQVRQAEPEVQDLNFDFAVLKSVLKEGVNKNNLEQIIHLLNLLEGNEKDLQAQLKAANRANANLERRLQEWERENADLVSKNAALNLLRQQIELKAQLTEANAKTLDLKKKVESAEQQASTATQKLGETEASLAATKLDLEKALAEKKASEEKADTLSNQLLEAKAKIEQMGEKKAT